MSLLSLLAHHIRTHGPILSARVSSAQSHTKYAYWGAVRYQIQLSVDVINAPCGRASSDRRSQRLALMDCEDLCRREGRIHMQHIGRLSDAHAEMVLREIGGYDEALRVHRDRVSRRHAPTLSLHDRFAAHLARKLGLSGTIRLRGRWVEATAESATAESRTSARYRPYGDQRDIGVFAAERNQERRRRIYEVCGERVLSESGMQLIQQDEYGRLYDDGMGGCVVRVVCPSTGAVYWLPVSRWVQTAHAAVAATFGLRPQEYAPVVQA